jgi:hypothetical protein
LLWVEVGKRAGTPKKMIFFFPWCFLLWVFSALLVLSDGSAFFCFLARFMLLGSFLTWVYFLLEPSSFLFSPKKDDKNKEESCLVQSARGRAALAGRFFLRMRCFLLMLYASAENRDWFRFFGRWLC